MARIPPKPTERELAELREEIGTICENCNTDHAQDILNTVEWFYSLTTAEQERRVEDAELSQLIDNMTDGTARPIVQYLVRQFNEHKSAS